MQAAQEQHDSTHGRLSLGRTVGCHWTHGGRQQHIVRKAREAQAGGGGANEYGYKSETAQNTYDVF